MIKKLFTAVLALMAFCNVVGAATHTTTFTRTDFTQKGQTCTYDGDVSWTNNGTWKAFDTLGAYFGWSSTKALQFGSTSNPCSEFSLTSGSFAGKTVTKVTVNSSTGTAAEATCTVSVGGKSFGTKTLTTDPTDYEFTGSASGDVVVSWAQTTERALYVKTITVEYEDAAGGSQQSETTVYDSGVFGTLEAVWNVQGPKSINGVDWTLSAELKEGATQPYFARNSTKGQQLGTANNPFTTINISTNAFAKAVKITKVEVNSSTATGSDAVLSVTVGGKSFGTQQTLSTTASDYAFEGDATGGNVVLTWTQTPENAKALYVKSIKVTYEKAAASVAKPVITLSSEATTNFAPVTVTINCETEGAAIYYTLDGTAPSDASTSYAAPFTVSENATIKAIAYKDGESSEVSEAANLTFGLGLANLAEFNALGSKEGFDKNTLVSVANDVTAIYHNRKYLYVKDASGYALLFDTNSKYTNTTINNGDVIPGGFFGKYAEFNMLPEMAYLDGVGELKAGSAVEPLKATVADITAENVNMYVKLSNVKLTTPVAKTFDMTDETGTVSCYNQFTVDMASLDTEKTYDVEGFVSISYDPQFYPTSITEHVAADGILYGTYAAPAALEDGKTYGLNADVTGGQFNYYTFESAEDVKITLTTTPGTNPGGGFGVSTGNFLMDDQYNDLEGAVDIRDELTTDMIPVGGGEGGEGGEDDFGVGFGNFTISSYWNAKAGVKYYIMCQGVGSFTVALSEPDMTEKVGTTENPINLNETPTWTWGTDGKVPGSATHYTFTAEKDGNLTITNGNEELYVGEDGWYDPFVNTSGPQYTGEIKKVTNWSDYTAAYTFAVEEGVTYCITIFDLTKGNDGEVIKAEFVEATPDDETDNVEWDPAPGEIDYNLDG
ncbi:MAG: chitobiase/beta-hexosaminidase C-terminal domain-containing protein, partial [Bacteroidaceae bacterium]|nr:chitobiase/beta-hexosaminidase C-terminal domain-containing protein [Bacteroidaceae bacterium]